MVTSSVGDLSRLQPLSPSDPLTSNSLLEEHDAIPLSPRRQRRQLCNSMDQARSPRLSLDSFSCLSPRPLREAMRERMAPQLFDSLISISSSQHVLVAQAGEAIC